MLDEEGFFCVAIPSCAEIKDLDKHHKHPIPYVQRILSSPRSPAADTILEDCAEMSHMNPLGLTAWPGESHSSF